MSSCLAPLLFESDELLEVLDQAVELVDLDELLDHVARVQKANREPVLLYRFVVLLLLEELVAVLLDNLADYLRRELGSSCDVLRDTEVRLLDERVNLFVVSHRVYPHQFPLDVPVLDAFRDVVDTIATVIIAVLNLNTDDLTFGRRVPKDRDILLQVVNTQV